MFLVRLVFPFWVGGYAAVVTVAACVVGVVVGAASGAYEKAFYEATAQIIPVLLLVLAVEARFFRLDLVPFKDLRHSFETEMKKALGDRPSLREAIRAALEIQTGESFTYVQQRMSMAIVLAALVAGEVISILILGQPSLESGALQGIVTGATFAGLAAVVVIALTGPMPERGG